LRQLEMSLGREQEIVHSDMRDLARVRVTSDFIVDQIRSTRQRLLPVETIDARRS
jgi:hypothetical protein